MACFRFDRRIVDPSVKPWGTGVFAPIPWTPAEITTALWLDAADSDTITLVSDAVSLWDDKSGNSRHATQSSSSLRPTYNATGLNSLPTLTFSSDRMALPEFMNYANPCFFIVGQSSNTSALGAFFVDYGNVSNKFYIIAQSTANGLYQVARDADGNAIQPSLSVSSGNHVIGTQINGTTLNIERDGISSSATNESYTATTWEGTLKAPHIGAFDTGASPLAGKISEIVVVFSVMTTDEFDKMVGYLAHKWGLEANLPSGHPYKTLAPTA